MRTLIGGHQNLLCLTLLLASLTPGCGGDTTGPSPAPTPGPTGRFVYASSNSSSTIAGYSINTTTGALIPIGQSSLTGGVASLAVATDPAGQRLFVSRQGGGIEVFSINRTTGALTLVTGSPFDRSVESFYLTVNPTGRSLFATRLANLLIDTLSIDATTGALAVSTGLSLGFAPTAPVLRPDGKFFYFAGGALARVSVASVDSSSKLTNAGSIEVPDVVRSLATDPSGNFLYVTTATPFSSDTLFAYRINATSGALTRVTGPAFAPGFDAAAANFRPDLVTFDPTGRVAFVLDRPGRTGARSRGVFVFPVQSSGLLGPTFLGPFSTPASGGFTTGDPTAFTLDASGKFAYLTDGSTNTISSFLVDAANGGLTASGGAVASPPAAQIAVTQ